MSDLVRFGVSMEASLARDFDKLVTARGYPNRSEAIRDMIRQELVRRQWSDPNAEAVGTVTILYDHHVRQVAEHLTALQHEHHDEVVSTTHVHLTHDHCLEVMVVRGRAGDVRALADRLISARGVLHGELVATTSGELFKNAGEDKEHPHAHSH